MLQALQRRNMVRCDKPHGIKAAIVTSTQQHVYINRNALEMNVGAHTHLDRQSAPLRMKNEIRCPALWHELTSARAVSVLPAHADICTQAHACAHTHACARTQTHGRTDARTRARLHTGTHVDADADADVCDDADADVCDDADADVCDDADADVCGSGPRDVANQGGEGVG